MKMNATIAQVALMLVAVIIKVLRVWKLALTISISIVIYESLIQPSLILPSDLDLRGISEEHLQSILR